MKKAFTLLSILILTFGLFMHGFAVKCPAYASIDDDIVWTPLRQQSDMVVAFQEYCKSRDLTIEGSLADAVTTFTTGAFNSICNTLGFNMTQLQAEIKAEYDANGRPVQFLFTATGIDAYNRIFAQFLQDNELEVGEAVDETVYSGRWFTDDDGYSCFITSINTTNKYVSDPSLVSLGSPYRFSGEEYFNSVSIGSGYQEYYLTFKENPYKYYINWKKSTNDATDDKINFALQSGTGRGEYIYVYAPRQSKAYYNGFVAIIENNLHELYLGYYRYRLDGTLSNYIVSGQVRLNDESSQDISIVDIDIYSPTINNNTYEGDTIINNYPDDDPDDPDPVYPDPEYPDPPTYDPDYPNDPITPQTPPDDWGIELPDFTDFDWIMSGLEKKFPWDIPFNIMFMLSLFAAEPEAPHFVGDIDLKVTTWHYDLDLAPFEELAEIFRKFFFISFLLGLMLLTKQLIWG